VFVDNHLAGDVSAGNEAIVVADLIEQGGHGRERVSASW
jgi:hypothetical protein